MLKRMICLCLICGSMLLAGALFGCAATSDSTTAAMSKDMEQLIATASIPSEDAEGQTLRESLGVPYRVEKTALPTQLEKFTISISADVSVPDVDHLSVYRVSAANFSQELVARVFHYFCKDETMYDYENIYQTRDQIQARIDSIQKDLDRNYSPNGQDGDDSWRAEYEADLADLKAQLPNALEDLGDPIQTVQFSQKETLGNGTYEEFLTVNAPEYPYTIELFAWNNVKYPTNEVQYNVNGDTTVAPQSEANLSYRDTSRVSNALGRQRDVTYEAQIAELDTTPAQAMEQAAALLDALEIDDMEPYRACLAREYTEDGTGKYAYYVEARRVVDGVEVQSPFYRTYVGDVNDGCEWAYETMDIRLDDEGIVGMNWASPLAVGAVEVAHANLLPFSSILSVAKQMLGVVNEPLESNLDAYDEYRINIDRITLSLQRIPDVNSIDSGLLIPVWNFYGTARCILPYGIVVEPNDDYDLLVDDDEPLLSINAIDGSVIDEIKGY